MTKLHRSICRQCINGCAIEVVTSEGVVKEVRGVPNDPMYGGHTCEKGRSQGRLLTHPNRLLTSLKRGEDGRHHPISSEQAMDEIAGRLAEIAKESGGPAIAGYAGTAAYLITAQTAMPMYNALFDAIGSPMKFDPNTIDKGGKTVAPSFLGRWRAPSQGFDRPRAILLIGINPWQTYTGFPAGSPKRWLQDLLDDGCKLIVIDPRRTHVAERADWYLQCRPGHDVALLAAMIKIVLDERLVDAGFVKEHVAGVESLIDVLAGLNIEQVCAAAGVVASEFREATVAYADAGRGYAMAGTGPNFGGRSTVVEYLVLVLETLLGHWLRAGETVVASPVLTKPYRAVAEAVGPDETWEQEPRLHVRGLRKTRAGVPTAALADEVLSGHIRALISWSGNPVNAFPDQPRAVAALRKLDLLVQIDPWYSETASLADYVIAPTMPLEVPATSAGIDFLTVRATGYGSGLPYANYAPAVVKRPAGSDLLEEWEFFYGLLARLGRPIEVLPFSAGEGDARVQLAWKPTTDELIELMSVGSRVPFGVVRARGGGALYPESSIVVEAPTSSPAQRLHVAHPVMMADLHAELERLAASNDVDGRAYSLLCRRTNHTLNTSVSDVSKREHPPYNPLYMNPRDMEAEGIRAGDRVRVESAHGRIETRALGDQNLRQGVVSMAFAYGGEPVEVGSVGHVRHPSVNVLTSVEEFFDPYTGQPRMTNIPVNVLREP
jgi:anaerobic selenocysteine-containing dehydrogenase